MRSLFFESVAYALWSLLLLLLMLLLGAVSFAVAFAFAVAVAVRDIRLTSLFSSHELTHKWKMALS